MMYLKSASSNLLTSKVPTKNKKTLNLGLKIPYLGILGLQFNKNCSQIFNQHPRVCGTISNLPNCKISWKNKNLWHMWQMPWQMPKFVTNALFGYFLARISKNYCHIWNQHPRICLNANFGAKIKMLKSGTKHTWFGYFWPGICIQLY